MALLRDQGNKNSFDTWASFRAVPKTLETVVGLCLRNERLKRLLYYTDPHALSLPMLTREQTASLIGTSIKIVPKLEIDPDIKPYIIISLDQFVPNPGQTTFKQVMLSIDILCAYKDWNLTDFNLRPYAIAGELDGMINNSFVSGGIGEFKGAKQLILNEHLGGCTLYYNLTTLLDDYEPQTLNAPGSNGYRN
ncbi:MAG: hypothetical protein GX025_10950 [Clostridiales bacterium]|nr:hypothetical protein [Clostridiales bacterium]